MMTKMNMTNMKINMMRKMQIEMKMEIQQNTKMANSNITTKMDMKNMNEHVDEEEGDDEDEYTKRGS